MHSLAVYHNIISTFTLTGNAPALSLGDSRHLGKIENEQITMPQEDGSQGLTSARFIARFRLHPLSTKYFCDRSQTSGEGASDCPVHVQGVMSPHYYTPVTEVVEILPLVKIASDCGYAPVSVSW